MAKAKSKSGTKASSNKPAAAGMTQEPKTGIRPSIDRVAEAAYYKAEKRGFVPGHEMQDWLEAEKEISQSVIHH